MNYRLRVNIIRFLFRICLVAGILLVAVMPVKAQEWPKEFAVTSVACIDSNDAHSILLTHKVKDLASAQGKYEELKQGSLCLSGNYFGTFVKVVHEVRDLDFGSHRMTGFVVEMDATGHQFFVIVLRKPDPEA